MLDNHKNIIFALTLSMVFIGCFIFLQNKPETSIENPTTLTINKKAAVKKIKPDYVRAIYLTANSAGSEKYRANIITAMKNSRINSVVIDVKDYSGYILYASQVAEVKKIKATKNSLKDVAQVLADFHEAGIYVIARQTVFQDPVLAHARPDLAFKNLQGDIWQDHKNLAWLNPAKQEVWEYNLKISEELISLGFDEINFDYMRYPSDGNMANLNYAMPENKTRVQVMSEFYKFLAENLAEKIPISVDMFGLVMDHTDDEYDLSIGQRLTEAVKYFDFVYPMMYPSHYPLTYLGFTNSAEHPEPVISYGLKISQPAIEGSRGKIRPWLQAFDLGATYDQTKINAQIEATETATTTAGWALWNARNYYPAYIFQK